ncbi:response regulator transcription factor [Streptomyces sp. NPDC048277]|uniref:response regulator transcription factor n=1 Tax=Streptomyces sp. NPDC048277 TaxID=3155027 RepID=UPI0033C3DED6
MRVLVIDPDDGTAEPLVCRLVRNGHQVRRARTGRAALEQWEQAEVVLLDLELPDLDGLQVCAEIRARGGTPLITFTSRDTEMDRVLSLRSGADDCLVKPYGFRELIARMNAVARRVTPGGDAAGVTCGALRVDPGAREAWVGGRQLELTRKEFDILLLLASAPETVVSRRDLIARVWADEWAISTRTVDTHVSALRAKLGDGWIVTVRGVGYRLEDAAPPPARAGVGGRDST